MSAWFLRKNGRVFGPIPEEELMNKVRMGLVLSTDEVSRDGRSWERLVRSSLWNPPKPVKRIEPPAVSTGSSPRPKLKVARDGTPMGAGYVHPRWKPGQNDRLDMPKDPAPQSFPKKTFQSSAVEEPSVEETTNADSGNDVESSAIHFAPSDFSIWKVWFSGVFQRHNESDLSSILSGNHENACKDGKPPRTWLWSRVFLISFILSCILLYLVFQHGNTNVLPGYFLISAFAVPLSVVIFFLECDISRYISAWRVTCVFIIGGVVSLLTSLELFSSDFGESMMGSLDASSAGFIEEPGKAVILLFFLKDAKRYPYILNGLVLGAAIGAGFASFESAGYAFNALLESGLEDMVTVAILRGVFSPFCHIAWTAAIGGAMWSARGMEGSLMKGLLSWSVLGVFVLSVGLHAIWNAGGSVQYLGQLAWMPLIFYLKKGLIQCLEHPKGA